MDRAPVALPRKSVDKSFCKSQSLQILQLILHITNDKGQVDVFVRELIFEKITL